MLYRIDSLATLRTRWQQTVFNEERPHCMDVDVALASMSDEVAYYAVPGVQSYGLIVENHMGSSRDSINKEAATRRAPAEGVGDFDAVEGGIVAAARSGIDGAPAHLRGLLLTAPALHRQSVGAPVGSPNEA